MSFGKASGTCGENESVDFSEEDLKLASRLVLPGWVVSQTPDWRLKLAVVVRRFRARLGGGGQKIPYTTSA